MTSLYHGNKMDKRHLNFRAIVTGSRILVGSIGRENFEALCIRQDLNGK